MDKRNEFLKLSTDGVATESVYRFPLHLFTFSFYNLQITPVTILFYFVEIISRLMKVQVTVFVTC